MPEAPVLTKKQIKLSLLAKKSKRKDNIRNVLASPYCKYWPSILPQDVQHIHSVLYKHLPKLVNERTLLWKDLKKVPRLERKAYRKTCAETNMGISGDKPITKETREGLIFGINDVGRSIENRLAKSLLITEDVNPRFMVEHLIDQSVLTQIPVLIVPKLRNVLKEVCGISSVVIAFTGLAKYDEIQTTIENIAVKCPIPRNHVHFRRTINSIDTSLIVLEDESGMEPNITTENNLSKNDECYLYRPDAKERAFIPKTSRPEIRNSNQVQVNRCALLPVSANPQLSLHDEIYYKSLIVKQICGDPNRNKRKIMALKAGRINNKQKASK